MKDVIMQDLKIVLSALNGITVCGKSNLSNLSGSISVLEEVAQMLSKAEVTKIEEEDKPQ